MSESLDIVAFELRLKYMQGGIFTLLYCKVHELGSNKLLHSVLDGGERPFITIHFRVWTVTIIQLYMYHHRKLCKFGLKNGI